MANKNKNKAQKRIRRARVEDGYSRKFDGEKAVSANLLGNFDFANARSKKIIERIFCSSFDDIKKVHLIQLANVIGDVNKEIIPRNFLRKKPLIIKWLDDHYDELIASEPNIKIKYQ